MIGSYSDYSARSLTSTQACRRRRDGVLNRKSENAHFKYNSESIKRETENCVMISVDRIHSDKQETGLSVY